LKTIYLDRDSWDLELDAAGNIAAASAPYQLAQDAASAIRTFANECIYDTTIGVPYWSEIIGHAPPLELLKARIVEAAMTVPGVVAAQVFLTDVSDRKVSGQVQIIDTAGVISAAGF